jgi:hypothetical protein
LHAARWIQLVSSKSHDYVFVGPQPFSQLCPQAEPGMVGGDPDPHDDRCSRTISGVGLVVKK